MPGTYAYKIAPLGGRIELEVQDDAVTARHPDGRMRWRLELARVTSVHVGEISLRHTTSRWFDLRHAGGRERIACNSASLATAGNDENVAQYTAAIADILRAIAEKAPATTVTHGLGNGTAWAFFVMGLCTLLIGIAFPVAGVLTNLSGEKFLGSIGAGVLFVLLGVVLMHGKRPWRPATGRPVSELLAASSGGEQD